MIDSGSTPNESSIVIFEIGIVHHLMDESCHIFYTCLVGYRIRTVESQMEVEVGILLFQSEEVVEIEHFAQRTGTVEIVHLSVAGVQGLRHVHDLCAQRSHTGTATYPYHLFL